MSSDAKDILFGAQESNPALYEQPGRQETAITNTMKQEPKKLRKIDGGSRRPLMSREIYALLYSEKNTSASHSLIPTDSGCGYRQPKARLGRKHVHPWQWKTFTNPAREDGLLLSHWRREADAGKTYPYAKFNKSLDIPTYTEEEYNRHLTEPSWTKKETDHLLELCSMFDLRFTIIKDRVDGSQYQNRSTEDLKERYYSVCNRLTKAHNPDVEDGQLVAYDAQHEAKRKEQLEKLLNRTEEQVRKEELLVAELKKIEVRKKERERKQQDLQKLISAAEQNSERKGAGFKKAASSTSRKLKTGTPAHKSTEIAVVFRSYDKSSGVSLRSSKMKTPMTLGHKKAKAIEQLLDELGIRTRPMPTEQICVQYNDLRNDILLLLDLKCTCDVCEFELLSLKHRHEGLPSDKQSSIILPEITSQAPLKTLTSGLQITDVVSSAGGGGRKRRLATLESSIIKKQKKH